MGFPFLLHKLSVHALFIGAVCLLLYLASGKNRIYKNKIQGLNNITSHGNRSGFGKNNDES